MIAVSKVSEITPQATIASRRYGRLQERLAPGADGVVPAPFAPRAFVFPPPRTSPGSPPWARATSSASFIGSSTGWWADSKPRTSSALPAGPAPVVSASVGSSRRQLVGKSADCESSRTASAPASNEANETPQLSLCSGRSCTRTQASVITPRIPSEPSIIRSGEGPAPEPGSRRLIQSPLGVTARTDSTRSSTWV